MLSDKALPAACGFLLEVSFRFSGSVFEGSGPKPYLGVSLNPEPKA